MVSNILQQLTEATAIISQLQAEASCITYDLSLSKLRELITSAQRDIRELPTTKAQAILDFVYSEYCFAQSLKGEPTESYERWTTWLLARAKSYD